VSPRVVIAVLAVAAGLLLGVELALGARDFGEVHLAAPCATHPPLARGGLDGTVQRIVLDALDRASCKLGTTRERLLLSLTPDGARYKNWSDADVQSLLRSSLVTGIDDAEARGELNGVAARLLRVVAQHAPVQLVVEIASHFNELSALSSLIP
jgi:hypothetical protein